MEHASRIPPRILPRILLCDLPLALARAVAEHLPCTVPPDGESGDGTDQADWDLVICLNDQDRAAQFPATPCLGIGGPRRQRLGGILRQARQMIAAPLFFTDDFALGDFILSPAEKKLTRADEMEAADDIALTDRETAILCYLARHRGHAVPREALLRDVWHYQDGIDTHTLETHIYRLRQKIGDTADQPRLLVTDAAGYRLNITGYSLNSTPHKKDPP